MCLYVCMQIFGIRINCISLKPTICKSCKTHSTQQLEETNSLGLTQNNVRSFNRLMSQIGQQQEISNQSPSQTLVQCTKLRSSTVRHVQIRQQCQNLENQSNLSNSSQFIWNTTQNCIYPQEIPFWHNVLWSTLRLCRIFVFMMSQYFWIVTNQECLKQSQSQGSYQIFYIKIRIEIHQIGLRLNSQRICRTILVKSCQMGQTQLCQQEWKQVVKTIKTVQSWIITKVLV